jgi:hypothetical protein
MRGGQKTIPSLSAGRARPKKEKLTKQTQFFRGLSSEQAVHMKMDTPKKTGDEKEKQSGAAVNLRAKSLPSSRPL